MKKLYLLFLSCALGFGAHSQNYIGSPVGIYTPSYHAATTIGNGGSVLVGNDGNWFFGGSITSADKGGDNAPNATGRSETITFSGTGDFTNAALDPGVTGNIIDGYAGVMDKPDVFMLPVGTGNMAYPITVSPSVSFHGAYFTGTGSNQNSAVNGLPATEFSPFIDVDSLAATEYSFSYPAGFVSGTSSYIFESGNTSASGTNGSTVYNLLSTTNEFPSVASTSQAIVAASHGPTQVYFGTSNSVLRVDLLNFQGRLNNDQVSLSWNTASEVNNKGFNVERSTDGSSFHNIGFIPTAVAGGNSSDMLAYSFIDASPVHSVINYYRLVQTDLNGQSTYSRDIVQVKGPGLELGLQLYPNPAKNRITVSGLTVGSSIQIISVNGQQIRAFKATSTTQNIDISALASGVYLLNETLNSGETRSSKFIVR